MRFRVLSYLLTLLFVLLPLHGYTLAEEKKKAEKNPFEIPKSVVNISKENTYPNPGQDMPKLEPSDLTEELIKTSEVNIENPDLIKMLNETTISTTPLAIGYRANIYLGQWPLNYDSSETSVNWEYKKANINQLDNRGGQQTQKLQYVQEQVFKVSGGLTSKIDQADQVKKMIMLDAMEKTNLPLAFETVVGQGTKREQTYQVPHNKLAALHAYSPAVNERGKITFGEVYIELKGSKKRLIIKNVTHQGIGAWIPVQDHLSFSFVTK